MGLKCRVGQTFQCISLNIVWEGRHLFGVTPIKPKLVKIWPSPPAEICRNEPPPIPARIKSLFGFYVCVPLNGIVGEHVPKISPTSDDHPVVLDQNGILVGTACCVGGGGGLLLNLKKPICPRVVVWWAPVSEGSCIRWLPPVSNDSTVCSSGSVDCPRAVR